MVRMAHVGQHAFGLPLPNLAPQVFRNTACVRWQHCEQEMQIGASRQNHCLHGGRLCQPTVAVSNTSARATELMQVSASKPVMFAWNKPILVCV
jgi:hypothetical protein